MLLSAGPGKNPGEEDWMMVTTEPQKWMKAIALAALALLIAGCGGGQDSAPATAPADATPAPDTAAPPEPAADATPGPRGPATSSGTVRYEGEVPSMPPIKMDADPGCAKKHDSPPVSEVLVLGADNAMANVFVRVKGGLPGGSYPAPAAPVEIDQHGCRYVPHVLGVMKGQTVKILNSDGLLHNVHALPKVNKTFNMAMPGTRTEAEVTFDQAEEMFKIKCDVHPWMGAYVQVMTHPFFDVTADDGQFELANLPAGSYEVEVWHERLGTKTLTAEVADGQSVELDFTMTR
jgi:plastocyanin